MMFLLTDKCQPILYVSHRSKIYRRPSAESIELHATYVIYMADRTVKIAGYLGSCIYAVFPSACFMRMGRGMYTEHVHLMSLSVFAESSDLLYVLLLFYGLECLYTTNL